MGRHSAPDDATEPVAAAAAVEAPSRPSPRPRHAQPDGQEAAATAPPEPAVPAEPAVESAGPAAPVEPAGPAAPAAPAKVPRATAADLALLRSRSDVRARVLAAIVVPFLLYTVVMFLIGRTDVYLIWIWIPLVTAGVLAGSFLDAAHRKPSD